jgi:hypothetical protein
VQVLDVLHDVEPAALKFLLAYNSATSGTGTSGSGSAADWSKVRPTANVLLSKL